MTDAKARILIVDDIAENRALLVRRFERRGFETREACDGRSALDLVAREPFDLVLLDVMMPDLDGMEVLQRIRERHSPRALPVVMVTARGESEDVVKALERGANDYVPKPVDFPVALARVRTQIALKQADEALQRANADLERRVAERTAELTAANRRLELEIAERERSEAQVRYVVHHDALTDLPNRVLFREQLDQTLARVRRHGESLAVLCLDLDRFKAVNDTLGHPTGDALLREVARRLQACIRESDTAARLGGDEFAIVQTALKRPEDAGALAQRIIEMLQQPCELDGHQVVVGVSVGIAAAPADGTDADQLLRNADLALCRAKADGRGACRFFEAEMDARAQARRRLELDLRTALVRGEFELHYQPLVSLQHNRVTGFEALLRWNHPERGTVSPGEFIPLAEEIGLIVPLGEWVLRRACAEAATWPEDVKVAVNLSPVQFKTRDLVQTVLNALASSGLAPRRLELEITESVLLQDNDATLAMLHRLRDLGVRISMDDFGTGYSSLSYLRSFPFDKIKIDQSFIRDLPHRDDSLAIVRAVTGLGGSLGMATTAEGVETEAQLDRLRAEGCTEVQGYYFSRPVRARDLPDLMASIAAGRRRAA